MPTILRGFLLAMFSVHGNKRKRPAVYISETSLLGLQKQTTSKKLAITSYMTNENNESAMHFLEVEPQGAARPGDLLTNRLCSRVQLRRLRRPRPSKRLSGHESLPLPKNATAPCRFTADRSGRRPPTWKHLCLAIRTTMSKEPTALCSNASPTATKHQIASCCQKVVTLWSHNRTLAARSVFRWQSRAAGLPSCILTTTRTRPSPESRALIWFSCRTAGRLAFEPDMRCR